MNSFATDGINLNNVFADALDRCCEVRWFSKLSEFASRKSVSLVASAFYYILEEYRQAEKEAKERELLAAKWQDFVENRLVEAQSQQVLFETTEKILAKDRFIKKYGGDYVAFTKASLKDFFVWVRGTTKNKTKQWFFDEIYSMINLDGTDCRKLVVPSGKDGVGYRVNAGGGFISIERFYYEKLEEQRVFVKRTSPSGTKRSDIKLMLDGVVEMRSAINLELAQEYERFLSENNGKD